MTSPVKMGGRLTMSTIFKPSQQAVERVKVVQEMAKEDEEKGKTRAVDRAACKADACISRSSPTFPSIPSAQALRHTPPLLVEALSFILSLLPRTLAAALPLLSRAFLYAAHTVLYGDLDMRDVRDPDALRIFLVTQRDVCSLTHTLRVPVWRAIRTDSGGSHSPHTRSHGQPLLFDTPFI
ncbi:hypothetical protein EDD85DRAFT_976090 [Armillaria nabsnona]|nr:hypothetical protein EDD85DRAFT_976090 [Armillaria nabsnona]